MKTKFDIGDVVYIPCEIKEIKIADEVTYGVSIKTKYESLYKKVSEKQVYSVEQLKEGCDNCKNNNNDDNKCYLCCKGIENHFEPEFEGEIK